MRVSPLIKTSAFAGIVLLAATLGAMGGSESTGTIWRTMKIGAGGWLTGIDISIDGSTRLVRTDTYGAYIWDAPKAQWKQLVTASSMPASDVTIDNGAGVYEIRVAPREATRLYMAYRDHVYRSDDRGDRWVRTTFGPVAMNANDDFRTRGEKMAVDPANPDVVYVGTAQNGLFVTTNGGSTWQPVDSIPKSAKAANGYPGISGIAFDPSSGTTASKTNVIYASSYGNGVYRSGDSGVTWKRLSGGPNDVGHGKIAADGSYYVIGDDWKSIWCFRAGTWNNITPAQRNGSWSTIVTDPFDATHVIAVREGGYLDISHDGGAKWDGIIWGPQGRDYRVATDVPWLAWTSETYMGVGDMLPDPVKRGRLWFAEGIGVWYTDLPTTATSPNSVTFTSQSAGIEQLVANQVIAPPGGKPLVASWDRPVFYVDNPDIYPSTHGPNNHNSLVMGWSLDYASTNPAFIVGIFNWWNVEQSAYSADGGRSWLPFSTYPPATANGKIGGGIAASTPTNLVWVPANNSEPYYTKDGGTSWNKISIPDVPTNGATGWGWGYFLRRQIVAADRVTPSTFYMYNYLTGLYRSSNGGADWTLIHPHEIAPFSNFNAELRTVPGHAGELFFTSGSQGTPSHPADSHFMRSINGGSIWMAVPDVLEVRAFGFGKARTGYPTIYIVGWVHRIYGIWRSTDNAQTWDRIGEFPIGSLDAVTTIDGDKNVYGTVYVGFAGSGYAYGRAPE